MWSAPARLRGIATRNMDSRAEVSMAEGLSELEKFLEVLLEARFPGKWAEGLTNGWSEQSNYWTLRRETVVTHLFVWVNEQEVPMLQVTCGLAADVPFSSAVLEQINATNSSLVFGRVFLSTDATRTMCAIVMQEIWPLSAVTHDNRESQAQIGQLVGSLTLHAEQHAAELIGALGGRSFNDEEALVVALIGD